MAKIVDQASSLFGFLVPLATVFIALLKRTGVCVAHHDDLFVAGIGLGTVGVILLVGGLYYGRLWRWAPFDSRARLRGNSAMALGGILLIASAVAFTVAG